MKRLYKNRFDKKIFGVFGGLGLYLQVDPNLLRLIFVAFLATPLFPILAAVYFLIAVLIPEGGKIMIENPGRKLYRSIHDRKIAGVCAGLGRYCRTDPLFIRVIFLILTFTPFFLPIIVTYIVGAMIMPEGD
jgi:phage shock protein C